ncbi:MAG TPA: hypothetical protein VHB02_06355 [Acidimicrobiales bacterium]|nr:hypothetical protein [Acidimicrobiales bacterium]
MNRLTRPLVAALVPLAGFAAVTVAPALASATTATPPNAITSGTPTWQQLQATALQVAADAQGVQTLNLAGLPSVPVQSTVTTPSGPVSLSQQTVVSTGRSGTVVVNLSLLGGKQEIVSEMNVNQNYAGETLVLAPGTSRVTGTYHLPGASHATASTSALHRGTHGHHVVTTASDGVYKTSTDSKIDLAAAYNCWANPQPPGVIGSIYGPLIQATGVIDCLSGSATLAMIVGLYQNNGAQKGSGSGSGWGGYLGINAYAPCYQTSWNWFQTAQIWAVNGALQPGASSSWSYLGCG